MLSWRPARQREAQSPAARLSALSDLTGMDMRLLRFLPCCALLARRARRRRLRRRLEEASRPTPSRVVGDDTITKAQFNFLLDGAKRSYAARKTPFPKPGTTQYKSLQDQAMQYLVQQSELEQKAKDLGIERHRQGRRRAPRRRSRSSTSAATRTTYQAAAEGAGPHRGAAALDLRGADPLGEALQRRSRATSRSPTPTSRSTTTRTSRSTRRPRAATCATSSSTTRRSPTRSRRS